MRKITCSLLIVLSLLALAQSASLRASTKPRKPLQDNFPSSNITNLKEIKTLPGFKTLKADREASSGIVKVQKIPDLIKFWGNSVSFPQDQLAESLKQMNETRLNSIFSSKDGNITFNWKWDNEESLYNLKATIRPHPTSQGVAQWEKILWTASVKPFDGFMAVDRFECSAFECIMKEKTNFVQSNITEKHVGLLENLAIPLIFE